MKTILRSYLVASLVAVVLFASRTFAQCDVGPLDLGPVFCISGTQESESCAGPGDPDDSCIEGEGHCAVKKGTGTYYTAAEEY
jgi:hypothetical protein